MLGPQGNGLGDRPSLIRSYFNESTLLVLDENQAERLVEAIRAGDARAALDQLVRAAESKEEDFIGPLERCPDCGDWYCP